ncbi:hypothetical protein J4G46_04515 [Acinetobacter towneri]|uniref:hypothetical protein n=1 Tax=Acinetobacter towneri TaxID=202956 RepID=UPI001AA0661F|nr:hypothetical protein [Acinetobacter towneri]QTD65075.1 hypothetical protein J4G46_04515 [Acinetobacter towneri]
MKKPILVASILSTAFSFNSAQAMQALNDDQLSHVQGQALLNLMTATDQSQGLNFYKLSVDALMELNANIKTLQLGCGGVNNAIGGKAGCDIDISNIALSGLNKSHDSTGSPEFNGERAGTSAQITNPFIEFAISGNSASTREVVGFRLGAEEILGLLTLGTDNVQNPNDGIKSFSGYMKMAQTKGHSFTEQATFGMTDDEIISGRLKALGQTRQFHSKPFTNVVRTEGHTGITVPSMKVDFTMPETVVTGQRMTAAKVSGIRSSIPSIPLAAAESGKSLPGSVQGTPDFSKDQLYVEFPALLGTVGTHSFFKMAAGSSLDELNMDITFVQALNMIHNIPLNGTGGYLSLQSKPVHWQGADQGDVAQQGWWMSFKEPIQLGYLATTDKVDISAVLPQVAEAISDYLLYKSEPIDVGFFAALGSLAGIPVEKKLNINVGQYTTQNPATITLTDKVLQNQNVTPNCYGGMKFC